MTQKQKFPRYYNQANFGMTADVICAVGKWIEILELQTPAQQEIAWGIGQASFNGVDTRKNITLKFYDTAVQLHGVYRIAIANANKTDIRIVMEDRSENLDDGVELGETSLRAKEDSYLLVFFNIDVVSTIDFDSATNICLLPATVYQ